MSEHSTAMETLPLNAHRPIRRIGAGEGPFEGTLVSGADETFVAVDTDALAGWSGWAHAGAQHIAAPASLCRVRDGHRALLPWCPERLLTFLARRDARGEPLSGGERSTLVASLLRGVIEGCGTASAEPVGDWWLTGSGRPVFVIGSGEPLPRSVAAVLDLLAPRTADRATKRLFARIVEALAEPRRVAHEADHWETELFELAAPKPLRTGEAADTEDGRLDTRSSVLVEPAAMRAVPARRPLRADAPRSRRRRTEPRDESWRAAVGARIEGAAEFVRRAREARRTNGVPDRAMGDPYGESVEEESTPRRWTKPMLVGAGIAAVLAVGGALWPSSPPADASVPASPPVPAAAAASDPPQTEAPDEVVVPRTAGEALVRAPADTTSARPDSGDTPLAALPALLSQAELCADGDDDACARAWASERLESTGPRPITVGTDSAPTVIEDYGDLAALRIAGGDAHQIVVLLRTDDGWRIRDVYEVADPPSEESAGDQAPS
ncbi:hypothetical protein GCM10025768_18520 [Microbacterium pseudoresistens]|uniref:Uncharacterized protein n=1 Tax=Microbacterium pseudoresistens TaxID=640634 RepID=A0A7Y9EXA7_9MICO|nr:hypothetical protein [Microbacterium pseudoresistens]NYD55546.1 hypothetical protein [Microbacterium pseudoresistens]